MYLSRLILNPRSRQVRSELVDVYELHRTVMKAFAGRVTETERVLFRVDVHPRSGIPTLLVQSQAEPDWSFLLDAGKNYLLSSDDLPLDVENPAVKPVSLALEAGQVLAFRLRANPTMKKVIQGKEQGQRVGLFDEDEQLKWLQRKIEAAGASLVSASIAQDGQAVVRLREKEAQRWRFASALFDGVLQVKNPDLLAQSVGAGLGSGKGLGFGLLSLAPARG